MSREKQASLNTKIPNHQTRFKEGLQEEHLHLLLLSAVTITWSLSFSLSSNFTPLGFHTNNSNNKQRNLRLICRGLLCFLRDMLIRMIINWYYRLLWEVIMDHPRAERVAEGMRIIHRLLLSHTRPPRSVRALECVCVCVCECVYVCVCAELRSARTDGGGEGVSRFCLNMKFDPPRSPYTHNLSHILLLNVSKRPSLIIVSKSAALGPNVFIPFLKKTYLKGLTAGNPE